MLIYFNSLLLAVLCAYLAKKSGNHRWAAGFFIFGMFAVLVLLPGLRDASVGTDTSSYGYYFERDYLQFSDLLSRDYLLDKESGFYLIAATAGLIAHQYWVLFIMIAIVAVFCHLLSIYRYSINPVLSLFVFVTLGYYTFFFNGARQGLACAVYTLSFGALMQGKFWKYALWVFIAALFHRSVVIALPLYFLFRIPYSLKLLLAMVALAIVCTLTFDSLLNLGVLISSRYALYQTLQATGAQMLTLFSVCLCLFFLLFRSFVSVEERKIYDIFLNMFMFGSTIYIIVLFSSGYVELTRIAAYFQVTSIFLWPIIFGSIRRSIPKGFLFAAFIVGHLVYFYLFLSKIGNLTPYLFNVNILNSLN